MTGIHPEFEEFSKISMENAKMFYSYMVDTSKSLIYKKVTTGYWTLKFMNSLAGNLWSVY